MSERLVVAMSGGVDSSLAAAVAVEDGFDAVGLTLHLAGDASRCCSLDDADDARRVAELLGIRFFVMNDTDRFRSEVIEAFADEYLAGRTPNPCVTCNKRFKFDALLRRARLLGAERVATGHYARVERDPASGGFRLRRAVDRAKDQSYFLFQLDQAQLARSWFPLGGLEKREVRARARALGLPTAEKPESQEVCFVPDGDYARVVEEVRPEAREREGELVDGGGRVLGRHGGVHRFTIGQRRGLGLAGAERLYVTAIDAETGRVRVGPAAELAARGAEISDVHWIAGTPPPESLRAEVQIRHRHTPASATVEPAAGGAARVVFDEPVTALAPGQAAVFYAGDAVLGGGWIAGPLA